MAPSGKGAAEGGPGAGPGGPGGPGGKGGPGFGGGGKGGPGGGCGTSAGGKGLPTGGSFGSAGGKGVPTGGSFGSPGGKGVPTGGSFGSPGGKGVPTGGSFGPAGGKGMPTGGSFGSAGGKGGPGSAGGKPGPGGIGQAGAGGPGAGGSKGGPGAGPGAGGPGGKGSPGGAPGGMMGKGAGGPGPGGGGAMRSGPGGMMGPGGGGPKGGAGGGGGGFIGGGGMGGKGGPGAPGGGFTMGGKGGGVGGAGGGFAMGGKGGGGTGQGGFIGGDGGAAGGGGAWQGPPTGDAVTVHSSQLAGHMANMNDSGVAAIEKRIKWRMLFFAGACCTVTAAVFSVMHFLFTFADVVDWSPCTFISVTFLLIFGCLMLVLDAPVPHPSKSVVELRDHIYTFGLFLTRFTGRGMWYMFLGSHVWVALYDETISPFFAFAFTGYLVLLGGAALLKGFFLSRRLHAIRKLIKDQNNPNRIVPEQYCADQGDGISGMDTAQLGNMLVNVTNNPHQFTEDELSYVMNALSFNPARVNVVSIEEINYWLKDSLMAMLLV